MDKKKEVKPSPELLKALNSIEHPEPQPDVCPECGGSGGFDATSSRDGGLPTWSPCPYCKGTGKNPDGSESLPTGRLLTDEQIEEISRQFYARYAGKGLSPSEVYELHHSEFFEEICKAQHSLDQSHYQEKLRQVKEGIEKHSRVIDWGHDPGDAGTMREFKEKWWQSFCKEVLGLT